MQLNRKVRRRLQWLATHTMPGKTLPGQKFAMPIPVPRHADAFRIDANTSPRSFCRWLGRGGKPFLAPHLIQGQS